MVADLCVLGIVSAASAADSSVCMYMDMVNKTDVSYMVDCSYV